MGGPTCRSRAVSASAKPVQTSALVRTVQATCHSELGGVPQLLHFPFHCPRKELAVKFWALLQLTATDLVSIVLVNVGAQD